MVSPAAGLHWQVPIEEPPAETRWQDTPTPPNEVRRSQQSNHACASPCHHISQMAHFLFCAICGYWWCLVCCCCVHLGITKVGPNMKDLEHSNYEHAFTIIRVITVAIYATIVQDVTNPPPQLFLTSPDAYLARVNSGGAVVLLQFLRHVGIPALQWQRAARSGEGRKLVKLMAIALHSFRCFQYKIGCAQISMLALISYLCVHDKLAAVVFAYSGACQPCPLLPPIAPAHPGKACARPRLCLAAVSLLGRVGRCMAIDRLLEYVNLLQQKRMNAFIGFDTALHHTPYCARCYTPTTPTRRLCMAPRRPTTP